MLQEMADAVTWKRTGPISPPPSGDAKAMVATPAGTMLVTQVNDGIRGNGWLTWWSVSKDGARLAGAAREPAKRSTFSDLSNVAAAYDPARKAVIVVGVVHSDGDDGYVDSVGAWAIRGQALDPLFLSKPMQIDDLRCSACFDPSERRVLLALDQKLYRVTDRGLESITTYEPIGGVALVADEANRRVLMLTGDGPFVLEGETFRELGKPSGWRPLWLAGWLPDRKAVLAVVGDSLQKQAAFEIRGKKITAVACDTPWLSGATTAGGLGAADRGGSLVLFTLDGGYRELAPEVPHGRKLIANQKLLYVDGASGRVFVREPGKWVEVPASGKVPDMDDGSGYSGPGTAAQDETGRLVVFTKDGGLHALGGKKWTKLSGGAGGPGPRSGAAMVATANDVLLFGGSNPSSRSQADTWRFAQGKWKAVKTKKAPGKRERATAFPLAKGMLLCGGELGGKRLDDVWIFDGSSWAAAGRLPSEVAKSAWQGFTFGCVEPGTGVPFALSRGPSADVVWRWSGAEWRRAATLPVPPPETLPAGLGEAHGENERVSALDLKNRAAVFIERLPVVRTCESPLPALEESVVPRAPDARTKRKKMSKAAAPTSSTLHRFAIGKPTGISRSGGEPIGEAPTYKGKPMRHVITLGRELIVPELPAHVEAISVFISDLGDNKAFTPKTDETKVVFQTSKAPVVDGGRGIAVAASEYLFDDVKESDEDEASLDADGVSSAIGPYLDEQEQTKIAGAEVLGFSGPHVAFLQGAETPKGQRTLFWFRDALVEGLNCGTGVMYVSADDKCTKGAAWWQC
jgi:hypothetical protein